MEEAKSHQHAASKQRELGGVGVKADLVLARRVRGEGEATFRTVLTRQDDLERERGRGWSQNKQLRSPSILLHHMTRGQHLLESTAHLLIRVSHLYEHPQTLRGWEVLLPLLVIQLSAVVT